MTEPHHQGRVAFLPFTRITLKALKSKESDSEPKRPGEHLRRRRLELEQTQRQVADRFGVNPWTVLNWEKGYTEPLVEVLPTIIVFLGYDPFPQPTNLSEHFVAVRRKNG